MKKINPYRRLFPQENQKEQVLRWELSNEVKGDGNQPALPGQIEAVADRRHSIPGWETKAAQ